VLLIGALGHSDQIAYRDPVTGHEEDLVAVSDYLGGRARPGDAVLFVPPNCGSWPRSPHRTTEPRRHRPGRKPRSEPPTWSASRSSPANCPTGCHRIREFWLIEGQFKHGEEPGGVDDASRTLLTTQFTAAETRTVTDVQVTLFTRS
jgi:hypothetical protein